MIKALFLLLLLGLAINPVASSSSSLASLRAGIGAKCVCQGCKKFPKQFCTGEPVEVKLCAHAKGSCAAMSAMPAHENEGSARAGLQSPTKGDPWAKVALLKVGDGTMGSYPAYWYQRLPGVKPELEKDPCRAPCGNCAAAGMPSFVDMTDSKASSPTHRVCLCNKAFLAATVPGQAVTPFPKDHLPFEFYLAGAVEHDSFTREVSRKFLYRCFNFIVRMHASSVGSPGAVLDKTFKYAQQQSRGISEKDMRALFAAMKTFFGDGTKATSVENFIDLREVQQLGVRDIHTLLWGVIYQRKGRSRFNLGHEPASE